MKQPKVSVYITTHNRCDLLPRAIESVLNQSYGNIELIISDDGSSDNTEKVIVDYIKKFPIKKIIYVKSEKPRGANHARNKAINVASGLFITGLDDDDEFLESRIESFVKNWDDKYSFICDNFLNEKNRRRNQNFPKNNNKTHTLENLLYRNEASNQIFTKLNRLKEVGGFNEELKKYQDWECWIRLAYNYGIFRRFNWCSYIMHHDHELVRVSSNSKHEIAYKKIIEHNTEVYEKCSYIYVDKCLVRKTYDIKFNDLVVSKSIFETKIMLFHFFKHTFNKLFNRA